MGDGWRGLIPQQIPDGINMRADEEDEKMRRPSAFPQQLLHLGVTQGSSRSHADSHARPRPHRITIPDGDKHTWPPPSVDLVGGLTQIGLLLFVLWLEADLR